MRMACVVVADLGLVVPEHRQPAVAAEAVQPQVEHFAAAAAGDDDRLPDVAHAPVVTGRSLGELGAGCPRRRGRGRPRRGMGTGSGGWSVPAVGHGGRRTPGSGRSVRRRPDSRACAEQNADAVEHGQPGVGGDDGRLACRPRNPSDTSPSRSRLALVGDESLHVLAAAVPGRGRHSGASDFQEGAQLQTGSSHVVERAGRCADSAVSAGHRRRDPIAGHAATAATPPSGRSGRGGRTIGGRIARSQDVPGARVTRPQVRRASRRLRRISGRCWRTSRPTADRTRASRPSRARSTSARPGRGSG